MTADYICKSNHSRAYWIDEIKYHQTFVYGKLYSFSIFKTYVILHLDDKDAIIYYTKDSFNNKFKKNNLIE
jgi:heptaprenylglyceryl phosphate synthase